MKNSKNLKLKSGVAALALSAVTLTSCALNAD